MKAPPGYVAVETETAWAFALPDARRWVARALEEDGTLHGWALSAWGAGELRGRGPVPVVPAPDGQWAVRHYYRGGAVAGLLEDRYLRLGEPRPVAEARWAREVGRRGVPTPKVVAGAVYPAGPFYRADLVTHYVPASRDLAAVLFGDTAPTPADGGGPRAGGERRDGWAADRLDALSLAGHLVVRTAEARVYHPDVNAHNVLLARREQGLSALLLDLDRCRLDVAGPDMVAAAMQRRLERSLRKLERATGRPLTEPEWEALRDAVRTGGPVEGA